MFTITDWAWNSKKKHEHDPKMWYVYDLKGQYSHTEANYS
jgi:hypothetical protein